MSIKADISWLGLRHGRASSIGIEVNDHFESKIYTSGSTISGHAVVSPLKDVHFDTFEVCFTGKASTRIDLLRPYPIPASRTFLRPHMPIPQGTLPKSSTFEAGRTYRIPFTFVVPSQLAASSCSHECGPTVQEQHLRLLPTMGLWESDDQVPETVQVEYSINALVFQDKADPARIELPQGFRRLKILPLVPEELPLHILPEDKQYRLVQTKMIRQNLFSSRSGKLRVEVSQPRSVEVSLGTLSSTGSSITVDLKFTPTSTDVVPPDIHVVSAKIQSATHYSVTHMSRFPNLGNAPENQLCLVVTYSKSYSVTTEHPGGVDWDQY
ncbi:hypothetical protein AK830_g1191 [Neonectria ditissima]|uniref:Arrestin-like N-terminal domain-containing protein n=1 Tax=Neonectria ditissima TaxID=78410 RepID=A0A0P7BFJ4_9HYPO|nr:hypothetical protein AK830_g1191 [Neonectria ditissima]